MTLWVFYLFLKSGFYKHFYTMYHYIMLETLKLM